MSERQFQEWQDFYQLEPCGPLRDDLRWGLLLSLVWGAWYKGKSRAPADWFPTLRNTDADTELDEDAIAQEIAQSKAEILAAGGTVDDGAEWFPPY